MRVGRMWRGCAWALLAIGLLCGSAGAQDARPATGRWYLWTDARHADLLAARGDSLWFAAEGVLWRYDVPSRSIESFTVLEGLPLTGAAVTALALSDAGDCAIVAVDYAGRDPSLCVRPAGGAWISPTLPAHDARLHALAFDEQARLVVLYERDFGSRGGATNLARWDGDRWTPLGGPSWPRRLWRLPGRWVLGDDRRLAVVTGEPAAAGQALPFDMLSAQALRAGGQDWLLAERRPPPRGPGPHPPPLLRGWQAFELGPDGPAAEPLFEGVAGLDLRADRLFELRPIEAAEGGVACEVRAEAPLDGVRLTVPRLAGRPIWPAEQPVLPVIDGNGHLWVGPHRWDGQAWSLVLPDNQFPFPDRRGQLRHVLRLVIEDGQARWELRPGAPPPDLSTWDSAERTGWRTTAGTGAGELQFVRVGDDGREEVLRRVPCDRDIGVPALRTADGRWWWTHATEHGRDTLYRLTEQGLETGSAPEGLALLPPIEDDAGQAHVFGLVSEPFGTRFYRYDAASDEFERTRAEPLLEQWQFALGPWKLSAAVQLDGQADLFIREDDGWGMFRSPCPPAPNVRVYEVIHGWEPVVRGDRMLISSYSDGVLEYSETLDRWVRLDGGFAMAYIDGEGRRILAGRNVLVFDGDPFAPIPNRLRPRFERVLAGLASSQYEQRQQASRELTELAPATMDLVEEALARPDLDPEVRARLEGLEFPLVPGQTRLRPESLLRRMHPAIETIRVEEAGEVDGTEASPAGARWVTPGGQ